MDNKNSPSVDELTPGTVTRTFYDRMPVRDTLGVELYPPSAVVSISTYISGKDHHRLYLCGSTMLVEPADKVTENFTGKEKDDETELNYFGARYLDPMLGMWTSVDPARQFSSPYLYAGNGVNPVNVVDPDGNAVNVEQHGNNIDYTMNVNFLGLADDGTTFTPSEDDILSVINAVESFFTGTVTDDNTTYNIAMKVIYNPEAENIVYIKDKIGESTSWATDQYTRKNLDIVCNDRALIFMKSSGFETTTPHEFAHLMGIKDRYTSWRDKNGIKHSKPHKGFKGNIMGSPGGKGLLPVQIQETLNKKSNKYENFDPWNNR